MQTKERIYTAFRAGEVRRAEAAAGRALSAAAENPIPGPVKSGGGVRSVFGAGPEKCLGRHIPQDETEATAICSKKGEIAGYATMALLQDFQRLPGPTAGAAKGRPIARGRAQLLNLQNKGGLQ